MRDRRHRGRGIEANPGLRISFDAKIVDISSTLPRPVERRARHVGRWRESGTDEKGENAVRLSLFALLLFAPVACYAEEPTTTTPALWGSPTVNNGGCCETLGEVRKNIDRLDREIVRLMAERGRYVHEAARFKANPAQVEAPERAEAVVQKAISLAQENGLPPKVAETTYRAMLRSFIDYEQDIFAAAAASGQAPWKK
jgi:isochorismate pyruvate lyase